MRTLVLLDNRHARCPKCGAWPERRKNRQGESITVTPVIIHNPSCPLVAGRHTEAKDDGDELP